MCSVIWLVVVVATCWLLSEPLTPPPAEAVRLIILIGSEMPVEKAYAALSDFDVTSLFRLSMIARSCSMCCVVSCCVSDDSCREAVSRRIQSEITTVTCSHGASVIVLSNLPSEVPSGCHAIWYSRAVPSTTLTFCLGQSIVWTLQMSART